MQIEVLIFTINFRVFEPCRQNSPNNYHCSAIYRMGSSNSSYMHSRCVYCFINNPFLLGEANLLSIFDDKKQFFQFFTVLFFTFCFYLLKSYLILKVMKNERAKLYQKISICHDLFSKH